MSDCFRGAEEPVRVSGAGRLGSRVSEGCWAHWLPICPHGRAGTPGRSKPIWPSSIAQGYYVQPPSPPRRRVQWSYCMRPRA